MQKASVQPPVTWPKAAETATSTMTVYRRDDVGQDGVDDNDVPSDFSTPSTLLPQDLREEIIATGSASSELPLTGSSLERLNALPPTPRIEPRMTSSRANYPAQRTSAQSLALATWLCFALSDTIQCDRRIPDEVLEKLLNVFKLALDKALAHFNCTTATALLGSLYICRMFPLGARYSGRPDDQYVTALLRVFFAGLRLAMLWTFDADYTLANWGDLMQLTERNIKILEGQALVLLENNLAVSNDTWRTWLGRLRDEMDTISDELPGKLHFTAVQLIEKVPTHLSFECEGLTCPGLPAAFPDCLYKKQDWRRDLEGNRTRFVTFVTFGTEESDDESEWETFISEMIASPTFTNCRLFAMLDSDMLDSDSIPKYEGDEEYVLEDDSFTEGASVFAGLLANEEVGAEVERDEVSAPVHDEELTSSSVESKPESESQEQSEEVDLEDEQEEEKPAPALPARQPVFTLPPPGYKDFYRLSKSTTSSKESDSLLSERFDKMNVGGAPSTPERRRRAVFGSPFHVVPMSKSQADNN